MVNPKKFKKYKLAIVFVVVLYFIYMLVIQPVLALTWFTPLKRTGSDIYLDKKYLKYDNGKDFEKCLSFIDFIDLCDNDNIIGFSYLDNFIDDNWIYNYTCLDYYILEAKYDDLKHDEIKNQLKTEGTFIAENQYYSYYRMDDISSKVDGYFIAALNQSKSSVKFIFMTTDIEPHSGNFWHEVRTSGSDDIWEFLSN